MFEFDNYKKLVARKAWFVVYNCGFDVEFEEVFAQCKYIFVKCQENYEERDDAKFFTYLFKYLDLELKNWVRSAHKQSRHKWDFVTEQPQYAITAPSAINDVMSVLDGDSQMLFHLIINCPETIGVDGRDSRSKIKTKAKNHLREAQGWDVRRFYKSFNNIKGACNELGICN